MTEADSDPLHSALAALRRQLQDARAQVERLEEGVKALEKVIRGSSDAARGRVAEPDLGRERAPGLALDPTGPRGREAVREILRERIGEWVNMDTLTGEIVSRGWVESERPREAIRTSADRLVKDDPMIEKGRGTYRLLPAEADRLNFDPDAAGGGEDAHDDVSR